MTMLSYSILVFVIVGFFSSLSCYLVIFGMVFPIDVLFVEWVAFLNLYNFLVAGSYDCLV